MRNFNNKKQLTDKRQHNLGGHGEQPLFFSLLHLILRYASCYLITNSKLKTITNMKIKVIFIGLVIALSSCTVNKTISYSIKDVPSNNKDQNLSRLILDVEEFADKRKDIKDNTILFNNPKQFKLDGQPVCINSEKHYKKSPVTRQITNMLVDHLNKRNSFKTVVMNKKDTADYYLSGSLTRFYGKQGYSTAASVGAAFGLIGALATAGTKTKGKIIIEITDLKIFDKNNRLVKDIGTITKEYEDVFPADAYCWSIFNMVNVKLKDYFSELIETIETELKNTN